MKSSARLPFQFNVAQLQQELAFCKETWTNHFNTSYYAGEWSGISLRSPKGANHLLSAGHAGCEEFVDQPVLGHMGYTQSVIDSIQTTKNAIRYLRLTPGSEITTHRDDDLVFWDGFVRLHIPVTTNAQVKFLVDHEELNMQEGECWFADFSKPHSVANHGETDRIHLVIDCKVNNWIMAMFTEAGIIEEGEKAPGEMDGYDKATKSLIIQQLEIQGTKTALEIASEIRKGMEKT